MAANSGSLVLLKIKSKDLEFRTIGGLRTTRMVLSNQLIDITSKESGPWRELLSAAGISTISISGGGVFTNSESEKYFRQLAFNNEIVEYQICFGSGDSIVGDFMISSYERMGSYNDEESYSLTIESSGIMKFISNL